MKFHPLSLPGAYMIDLEPRGDERGRFTRLFCANELKEIGHVKPIVNINHSYTQKKGTIRGMHFQYLPDAEVKIVKCLRGAIWDCIVDLRKDSPTFFKWEAVELTQDNHRMIYIPEGFAHGFQSLTDDVEIVYFVSNFYAPNNEAGLRFDDPALNISWPVDVTEVSARDREHHWIDNDLSMINRMTMAIHPTAKISPHSDIEASVRGTRTVIGAYSVIDSFVKIKPVGGTGDVIIGEKTYINSGCVLYSGNGILIGNHVSIASNCTFAPVNHEFRDKEKLIQQQGFRPSKGGIIIEDDVWIGANCVLLDGCILRKGCVIGASSLVRGEIPAFSIQGGNPLKILGWRK